MFGLAAKCGLSHEDLRDMTAEITNGRTEHTSKLYTTECDELIHRLESFVKPRQLAPRTVHHRRQQAGVPQIATQKHLKLMNDLAARRGMSEQGLRDLCFRTIHKDRPITTGETNKIVEALKDMNRRDGIFGAFKKREAA